MKKNNFTVTEILIVVIIVGVLATIGVPLYYNTVENAKARACELNLKTILGAVEAQTLEHDSFPASLSGISDKNFNKAWAKVLKEEGAFKVKFTYFLVNLDKGGLVYAANAPEVPWIHKFISDGKTLTCPSVHSGNSYGINASLEGKTYEQYKQAPEGTLVVGDCNNNKFSGAGELEPRHKMYNFFNETDYALTINKKKEKIKVAPGGAQMPGNLEHGNPEHGNPEHGNPEHHNPESNNPN